ncbi:MAG: UDP-N-acetylmuramoyl-tripeptide--D-alanyl-D-alanine ligase [Deltaproteobacteria bacterium]|nr:UDP-N-acetylmuramoyl-tripeptide--D-alanyl-D-alanine ligase [Deltaproteobacteria bacterium]
MAAKWGEITGKEISSAINGRQISGSPDEFVKGLSTDSRKMTPGHIFLALKGQRYDGHNFLTNAINAGAMGVIVESDATLPKKILDNNLVVINVSSTLKALGDLASWWRRQWGGKVIAITGSNGKSTTKEMAASILSRKANTMKSPGNFNNLIGLPLTILMLQEHHKLAVLEMGMNMTGEIARLTQIADPDIGLITNVESAHLEGLGNLNGVMRAKGELLRMMSKASTAILNGDDKVYKQLAPTFQGKVITFGLGKRNKVRAEGIKKVGDRAQAFNIYINGKRIPVRINYPGLHNVLNALSGAAIAFCLSISNELIAQGLGSFSPLKGRFHFIDLKSGIRIIDDTYNANLSSLRAALQTIKGLIGKKHGLVIGLGEMMELGKESPKYHFDAGRLVADMGARYLVVMGEHGRNVIEGACQGGMDREQTYIATTHAEMSDSIKAHVRKGDVIFMKGSRKLALDKVVESVSTYFGLSKG